MFYNLTIIIMWKRYELKKWDKFWRLTILWENKLNKYKNVLEKCICECGKERWATHYQLTKGIIKSCGCLLADTARAKQRKNCRKHWLWTWKNRFSRIYQWIRRRCKNQNDKAYPQYWGRWIKILWDSIEEFYNDMYDSYTKHVSEYWEKDTTIDRIDVNGDYCKENCKWSTMKEQQNNRTNNAYVMIDGISYSISEFAEKFKIRYTTAGYRILKYKKGEMSYESLTHIWKILSHKDKKDETKKGNESSKNE